MLPIDSKVATVIMKLTFNINLVITEVDGCVCRRQTTSSTCSPGADSAKIIKSGLGDKT